MGSKASCWPLAARSASISASGVPAFAESTSSSGSYRVTPVSAERSSVRSVCAGRPIARFEPCPTISTVLPSASAHGTAASTSLASRGWTVSAIAGSEPRNIRKRYPPGVHVHAPELGAAVQRRKHLARVEQTLVVEGAFEPLLLLEVSLGEHGRHQVALFHAHPVLAGEHAADLDAKLEDVRAELFRTLELARLVGVVENERVEIAVAGMEDVGDGEPIGFGQLAHALEHLRQPRARDGAGHAGIVGRDAADRRERRLAPGPEQEPLLLGGRDSAGRGAARSCDRLDTGDEVIDLGARPVD